MEAHPSATSAKRNIRLFTIILMVVIATVAIFRIEWAYRTQAQTLGIVKTAEETPMSGRNHCLFTAEFSADSHQYTFKFRNYSPSLHEIGSAVAIRYNPRNPEENCRDTALELWGPILAVSSIAAFLLLVIAAIGHTGGSKR